MESQKVKYIEKENKSNYKWQGLGGKLGDVGQRIDSMWQIWRMNNSKKVYENYG